ncbi:MAG: hypothetical protein AAB578_05400, partial [Elusimicrobiota bacterium]
LDGPLWLTDAAWAKPALMLMSFWTLVGGMNMIYYLAALQGIRAVIAQSFERIHRSNLVGMGVLPLQFEEGQSAQSLGLKGTETFDIQGVAEGLAPRKKLKVSARGKDGSPKEFTVLTRIDTPAEVEYYRYGGILPYVLSQLAAPSKKPVCA